MTFWKATPFRALQRTWYKRLEECGFHDAEKIAHGEMVLKQSASHPYKGKDELTREIKEHYYQMLAQQVEDADFASDVDRLILSLYADGKKIKIICEELEKRGDRRCRGTIRFTIRKYEMEWGIRKYTARQLNRKTG